MLRYKERGVTGLPQNAVLAIVVGTFVVLGGVLWGVSGFFEIRGDHKKWALAAKAEATIVRPVLEPEQQRGIDKRMQDIGTFRVTRESVLALQNYTRNALYTKAYGLWHAIDTVEGRASFNNFYRAYVRLSDEFKGSDELLSDAVLQAAIRGKK